MSGKDSHDEAARIADLFDQVLAKKFDISRYQQAGHLSLGGWYDNLSIRRMAMDRLSDEGSNIDWGAWFFKVIEQPIMTKIDAETATAKSVDDLLLISAWEMRNVICRDPVARSSCEAWEQSLSETLKIDPKFDIGTQEWFDELRRLEDERADDSLFSSYNDLSSSMYSHNHLVYAEINLAAPDDVLIGDFKAWLADKRAEPAFIHSPVKKFTEADFSRWAQKRVLAYIDLTLGAKYFGVGMPFHRLGDLLFPEYDSIDLAEKVRKTVAPLAKELLSYEHLEALREAANARLWREAEEN